jgi:hypothetical protein
MTVAVRREEYRNAASGQPEASTLFVCPDVLSARRVKADLPCKEAPRGSVQFKLAQVKSGLLLVRRYPFGGLGSFP